MPLFLNRGASAAWRFFSSALNQERMWGAALLIGLIALRIVDPSPVRIARVQGFDVYQQLNPATDPRRAVVIVDIDEESLREVGQWPWPRTVLAELVDRLGAYDVVAIGFDALFPEADRTSPAIYARQMTSLPPPLRSALDALPSNDDRFARALRGTRTILGAALNPDASGPAGDHRGPVNFAQLGTDPRPYLFGARGLVGNIDTLREAAAGIGLINNFPEFDGIVRRVPALYRVGDNLYPALAVEMIRVATGAPTIVVRSGPDGVEGLVVSNVFIPTDANGRLWVHYGESDPSRYISARDVLAGRVDADRLRGKLVLVGSSAAGLLDIKSTPVSRTIPGVEVHAMLIENILFGRAVQRPAWALSVETLITFVIGLFLVWFVPRLGAIRALAVGALVIAPLAAAAWFAFTRQGLMFDVLYPSTVTAAVYALLAFANYRREEKAKKQIHDAFGHYLSPALVEQLAEKPQGLVLGGEMRELSVLFSDVRGFSGISEQLTAQQLTSLINDLMTPLADVILDRGGTIDKFIGDAIMAFWNAPIDDPDHARHACHAALAMQDALRRFNAARAALDPDAGPIEIGVGINTGPCCVGNLGTAKRFDYSAIGDAVNVASRLEGETKTIGAPVIVGESTRAAAPDFAALEIGKVTVKGRVGETRIFALLGDPDFAATPEFAALRRLHEELVQAAEARDPARAEAAAVSFESLGGSRVGSLAAHYVGMAHSGTSRRTEHA